MNFNFSERIKSELAEIEAASLFKKERIITSEQGAEIVVNGKTVLNFCANNYLGLSSHPKVIEAAHKAIDSHGYGMSSVRFICGTQDIHKTLEQKIAQFLGTEDTILYAAAFDANGGVFEPLFNEQDAIISDALNHASIIDGVRLCKAQRYRYEHNNMEDLENKLKASDKKTLVSLMHANNEIGTLLDIEKVGDLCQQYHALFHSDTVQTFAHFPIDVQRMHLDFMSGAAHKFHGPKGAGFLYMRKQNKLQPLIHGGGQERGMRSGTENVYGIVGMGAAAKSAYANLAQDKATILAIKNYFIQQLKATFSDIDFNGNTDERSLYTVLNVSFPPSDKSALLLFMLDMEGVCCSGGSACGSGASTGSHVIRALKKDENRVSIRFSFSKRNTKEEVDFVIEKLKKIYEIK